MKQWISYKKALAYSGMCKAVFDRKLLHVGDHFYIQDNGRILFSKRFLDFPDYTVFSEIGALDHEPIRFEDASFHEDLIFRVGDAERVVTCKKKWFTFWEAIDYTGMERSSFEREYIGSSRKISLENGKLFFRKHFIKSIICHYELFDDSDDIADTYHTIIASRFQGE